MAGLDCSMLLWWAGWLAAFREGSLFEAGKIDARFRVADQRAEAAEGGGGLDINVKWSRGAVKQEMRPRVFVCMCCVHSD